MDPLTLIGAIPTALNTVNSLATLFEGKQYDPKQYTERSREVFSKGGKLRGHNKYNAPSHAQGGQLVDDQGIPDPNGTNEIETKEASYTYTRLNKEKPTYIFTPEDAVKVEKLTKKYKHSNVDNLQKNGLELEVQRVENANEMKKKKAAPTQYKKGGKIYSRGGSLDPLLKAVGKPRTDMTVPELKVDGSLSEALTSLPLGSLNSVVGNPNFRPVLQDKINREARSEQEAEFQGYRNRLANPTPAAAPTIQTGAEKYAPKLTDRPTGTASTPERMSAPKTNNPLKTLDTLRNLTLAGSSLGLLTNNQKEKPILTDYTAARKELNKLSADLNPAREDAHRASNQLRNVNRNSGSYNSFRNNEAQRVANLTQQLGNITMKETDLTNNIASQRAQFEAGVSQDNKQTLQQNRINNQQNKSAGNRIKSEITSDGLAELDRRSSIINEANVTEGNTIESMAYLGTMFENFGPADTSIVMKVKKSGVASLTPQEKQRMLNWKPIKYTK